MAPRRLALLGKVLLLDGGEEESGNEDGVSGRLLVLESTLPPPRPGPPLTIDPSHVRHPGLGKSCTRRYIRAICPVYVTRSSSTLRSLSKIGLARASGRSFVSAVPPSILCRAVHGGRDQPWPAAPPAGEGGSLARPPHSR